MVVRSLGGKAAFQDRGGLNGRNDSSAASWSTAESQVDGRAGSTSALPSEASDEVSSISRRWASLAQPARELDLRALPRSSWLGRAGAGALICAVSLCSAVWPGNTPADTQAWRTADEARAMSSVSAALRAPNVGLQPSAATPTGAASDLLEPSGGDKGSGGRAQRAERLKARREAAQAKRKAAAEARREAAQARREAAQEKRQAWREKAKERREAAKTAALARREKFKEQREALAEKRKEQRESASTRFKERREAAAEARREAAEARREAAEARREAARERREAAKARREEAVLARRERESGRDYDSGSSSGSAAPGTPGTLRINSRPWAQVYVDGRFVGHTPQLGISVSPGEHDVRLINTVFEMSAAFPVEVGPGERVTRIEMLHE